MKFIGGTRMDVDIIPGRAVPYDPIIADLIWQTDVELFNFIYGHQKQIWDGLARAEWEAEMGFHDRQASTVAVKNGASVGLLIAYPGGELQRRAELSVARFLVGADANFRAQMTRAQSAMGWLFPAVPSTATYIMNLAVSEDERGTGVGGRLIETAKSWGQEIHLDTAADSAAVKFYVRMGFEPVVETRLCNLRPSEHVPAHLRMVYPAPSAESP